MHDGEIGDVILCYSSPNLDPRLYILFLLCRLKRRENLGPGCSVNLVPRVSERDPGNEVDRSVSSRQPPS